MPLLEIATAQTYFQNNVYALGGPTISHIKVAQGNEKATASSWKQFRIPGKTKNLHLRRINLGGGKLMIKAVATLEKESTGLTKSDGKQVEFRDLRMDTSSSGSTPHLVEEQSSIEDLEELDERERLRRMRISKANKGNTPWNKGRKHSQETRDRIRERTRIAMQDPKIKLKLANLGHAQSKETRMKIGIGVRIGWERRRERRSLQETCLYQWQDLIAEASRRGLLGEDELQWDSYKILDEQLEQEWLQSIEKRRKLSRPKGGKRAPKSPEQRKKIAAAIAAKWADPEYRNRVYSGLAKYHGVPVGVERKTKRKASSDGKTNKESSSKKKDEDGDDNAKKKSVSHVQRAKMKRTNMPLYKDPLASSKLEMLKNIRAQRAAAENKKAETVARARLLIAESEKAALALEVAAVKSPLARASLIESRKLIAEAIQFLRRAEEGEVLPHENDPTAPQISTDPMSNFAKQDDKEDESFNEVGKRVVNGAHAEVPSNKEVNGFHFNKFALEDLLNGKDRTLLLGSTNYDLLNGKEELYHTISSSSLPHKLDNIVKHSSLRNQHSNIDHSESQQDEQKALPNGLKFKTEEMSPKPTTTAEETPCKPMKTKKWVRGRLVDVAEDNEIR